MDFDVLKEAFADDPVSLLDEIGLEYSFRGKRLEVLCPFHSDTNIGNAVIKDGYFHCFACGSSSDVIELVKQTENCNFGRAIQIIAGVYGIQLKDTVPERTDLSLSGKERAALSLPQTPFSLNRLTEADRRKIILKRIETMIPKYEELIYLYGDPDAEEAWILSDLCGADSVTFAKIKRQCENRVQILNNLKSRLTYGKGGHYDRKTEKIKRG